MRVCPAALYKIDENGATSFDYAGCLECGTCRIACGDTIVKKWGEPPAHDGRGVLASGKEPHALWTEIASIRALLRVPAFSVVGALR